MSTPEKEGNTKRKKSGGKGALGKTEKSGAKKILRGSKGDNSRLHQDEAAERWKVAWRRVTIKKGGAGIDAYY